MVLLSSSQEHGIYYYDWREDAVFYHEYDKKSLENFILPLAIPGIIISVLLLILGLNLGWSIAQWIIAYILFGVVLLAATNGYERNFNTAVRENKKISLEKAGKETLAQLLRLSERNIFPIEKLRRLGFIPLALIPLWLCLLDFFPWGVLDITTLVAILLPSLEMSLYILHFMRGKRREQCIRRIKLLLQG